MGVDCALSEYLPPSVEVNDFMSIGLQIKMIDEEFVRCEAEGKRLCGLFQEAHESASTNDVLSLVDKLQQIARTQDGRENTSSDSESTDFDDD